MGEGVIKKVLVPPISPHYTLSMFTEKDSYHLNATSYDHSYRGISVIARPDVTTGLLKRERERVVKPYVLQVASGNTLPFLKVAFVPEYHGSSQCICGFKVPCAATG